MPRSKLKLEHQPKIVIVGAGPAGIAAASKLYETGFQNVIILEAEDRIGGRIHTARFDNSWVDLGAHLVHGETNNVAFELASPLGLLDVPRKDVSGEFIIHNSKGLQIPTSMGNKLVTSYHRVVSNLGDDLTGKNCSAGEYYTKILTAEFGKYPTIDETLARDFLKLSEGLRKTADASDSWYDTSTKGYLEFWRCSGSNIVNWKDRGYATILDILMKKYPNPEEELPVEKNILLNSEVANINYNSIDGKAVVETSDGKQYVADYVIITTSLGVLKAQHQTLFTPQLPEAKVKTIKGLTFGSSAKIYLSFEAPWWSENPGNFALMWNDDDRQEYENDPKKKWLLDLNTFTLIEHRPRILCGWLSGASARYMETLSEDEVFDQTFALLKRFLGQSYNITRPTGMLRTKWCSNKHFRGTWGARSMESEESNVWPDGLAAPLLVDGKPIVMFAGEATHPHYYSTVHGAIETGFREANRIIDLYKDRK